MSRGALGGDSFRSNFLSIPLVGVTGLTDQVNYTVSHAFLLPPVLTAGQGYNRLRVQLQGLLVNAEALLLYDPDCNPVYSANRALPDSQILHVASSPDGGSYYRISKEADITFVLRQGIATPLFSLAVRRLAGNLNGAVRVPMATLLYEG